MLGRAVSRGVRLYGQAVIRSLRPPLLWSNHSTLAAFSVLLTVGVAHRAVLLLLDRTMRNLQLTLFLFVICLCQALFLTVLVHSHSD